MISNRIEWNMFTREIWDYLIVTYWRNMASGILIAIGLINGLVPVPLPKPMLTYCQ